MFQPAMCRTESRTSPKKVRRNADLRRPCQRRPGSAGMRSATPILLAFTGGMLIMRAVVDRVRIKKVGRAPTFVFMALFSEAGMGGDRDRTRIGRADDVS